MKYNKANIKNIVAYEKLLILNNLLLMRFLIIFIYLLDLSHIVILTFCVFKYLHNCCRLILDNLVFCFLFLLFSVEALMRNKFSSVNYR
jgi:hypothetical protein